MSCGNQSGGIIAVLLLMVSGVLEAQSGNYSGFAYIYYNPQFESYPWVTSPPALDYPYITQAYPESYPYYYTQYDPSQPGYSTPIPYSTYPSYPIEQSYPPQPPYPTQPPYPAKPAYPPQPTYPPQPVYPPQPSYPPQPTYPPQPVYPPQPAYPPQTTYPPQPVYPPQPSYPLQPTYPPQPSYPTTREPVTRNPNPLTLPPYPPPTGPTAWPTGETPATSPKTAVWPTGPPTKPPSIQMWPTGKTTTTHPTTPITTTPAWPTGRAQTTKPPSHQIWPTGRSGTTMPHGISVWPTGTPVDEEPELKQEWPTNPPNVKSTTPFTINWPTGPDKIPLSITTTETTTTEKWPTGSPSSKFNLPRWPTRRPGTAPPIPDWPTIVAITTPPTPPPVWPTMKRNEKLSSTQSHQPALTVNLSPTANLQPAPTPAWTTQRTRTHPEPLTFSPSYTLQRDFPTYIVPLYHFQATTPWTETEPRTYIVPLQNIQETTKPPTQYPDIPYTLSHEVSTETPLHNSALKMRILFQPVDQAPKVNESKRLPKTKPPLVSRLPKQLHTHPVTVTPAYFPVQNSTVNTAWPTYIVPLVQPRIPSVGAIPLSTTITTMHPTTTTSKPTTIPTTAIKRCNKLCLDENGNRNCCGNESGQCPTRSTNCSRMSKRMDYNKSKSPCVLDTQCAENFKCCLEHCTGEYYCTRVAFSVFMT